MVNFGKSLFDGPIRASFAEKGKYVDRSKQGSLGFLLMRRENAKNFNMAPLNHEWHSCAFNFYLYSWSSEWQPSSSFRTQRLDKPLLFPPKKKDNDIVN